MGWEKTGHFVHDTYSFRQFFRQIKYETWSLKLSLSSKYMPRNLTDLICLTILFPTMYFMAA